MLQERFGDRKWRTDRGPVPIVLLLRHPPTCLRHRHLSPFKTAGAAAILSPPAEGGMNFFGPLVQNFPLSIVIWTPGANFSPQYCYSFGLRPGAPTLQEDFFEVDELQRARIHALAALGRVGREVLDGVWKVLGVISIVKVCRSLPF